MNCRWIFGLLFAACLVDLPIQGALTPYSVDSATLHLWHFDETTLPCVDAAPGGTNLTCVLGGVTLGIASYSTNSPVPASGTNILIVSQPASFVGGYASTATFSVTAGGGQAPPGIADCHGMAHSLWKSNFKI